MQLNYKIFVTSNNDYIENTFVCLFSFFKYNNSNVTLYIDNTVTEENLERFKIFDKLNIEKIDIPEIPIKESYKQYKNIIKLISAKIYLFDKLSNDYLVSIDTDTLFTGNIEELFKEYSETLIGVKEDWEFSTFRKTPYLNAGMLIYKRKNLDIFNKYIEFLSKDLDIKFPEQDFLNHLFYNESKTICEKYNYIFTYYKKPKDIRMIHYSLPLKPFNFSNTKLWIDFIYLNDYFDLYFKYFHFLKDIKIYLSEIFYFKCLKIYNILKFLYKVKHGKNSMKE